MKAPKFLMMGTSATGKGGIATVVAVLQREGFFERNGGRYVVTHLQGSPVQKIGAAMNAVFQLLGVRLRGARPCVHVHSASRASFFRKSALLWVARVLGCKTVFHLHGAEFRQFATVESGPLVSRWIRHTLRRSSAVVTLSESWARFLREFAPGANVVVIPNSVQLPAVTVRPDVAPNILFLGRAEQRKGIFDLLRAVRDLAAVIPEVKLVIGGDGDLDAVVRAAEELGIRQHVDIAGWMGGEEKARRLEEAMVFCLPSHDEGLPMAMLEAMAAGLPVVVTPVGGIPEAIVHGDNGMLVPPGQPAELAAVLGEVLRNKELRNRLGARARQTIETRFGTAVVLDQLSHLYDELARK
ncbi:glycosyltransferase family 4 protein [Pseudoduganella sp. SL102]|uniref:glycosyltransferase family 4 protein n=1 Tax=Pseudoduganella sp. SL102 TaxID=2995154 RepID=UPI00248C3091|nr:glycosyltransferase family 4 protein [Pseudoduganella sp. SL102]WBS04480.1 glycosyltransferase family 4 protein [Pseudoduganella sp. SL102]